jgi:hypothetical protein
MVLLIATITTKQALGVNMNIDNLVRRGDELIMVGNGVLATRTGEGVDEFVDSDVIRKFHNAMIPVIEEVYGHSHPLSREFATEADKYATRDVNRGIEFAFFGIFPLWTVVKKCRGSL